MVAVLGSVKVRLMPSAAGVQASCILMCSQLILDSFMQKEYYGFSCIQSHVYSMSALFEALNHKKDTLTEQTSVFGPPASLPQREVQLPPAALLTAIITRQYYYSVW